MSTCSPRFNHDAAGERFPEGTGLHRDSLLILGRNAGVEACPERCFGPVRWVAKNLPQFRCAEHPFFAHFRLPLRPGRRGSFSARAERILLQRDLSGRLTCTSLLQGRLIVPRHPRRRILGHFAGVVLQRRAMREYAGRRGWRIAMQVKEIGSGASQRVPELHCVD
jgi:hypothetical protein